MSIDLRTDEQKAIDRVVEAKIALDSPLAVEQRHSLDNAKAELDAFVPGSKDREQILLARHAKERDDFAARELKAQNELQEKCDRLSDSLQRLANNYTEAFDAVRAHYASVYPGDDPSVSIRRILQGDAHPGADVKTFEDENGRITTRIRRGLHEMASGSSPEPVEEASGVRVAEEAETPPEATKKPWPYSFGAKALDPATEAPEKE